MHPALPILRLLESRMGTLPLHPALGLSVGLEARATVLAVHSLLKTFHLGIAWTLVFATLLALGFLTFVLLRLHSAISLPNVDNLSSSPPYW